MRPFLILVLAFIFVGKADGPVMAELPANDPTPLEAHIHALYTSVDFGGAAPAYDLFERGMTGYYNLKGQGRFGDNAIISLIDYRLSSNVKRLWVIDLGAKRLLFHSLVAHGRNSGDEYARSFSNREHSLQSSLGFYVTGATYEGKHGLSLRLEGLEDGFNDKAGARAVVMHGAAYVSSTFIRTYGRLGRSQGCPALPADMSDQIISMIAKGSCLFIFGNDAAYLLGTRLNDVRRASMYVASAVTIPAAVQ